MKKTIIGLAVLLSVSSISAEEFDPLSVDGLDELDSVLSATNRKQAKRDAPGSVSKITREQIKRFNIKTILEAMQHVPGMNALNFDGSTAYVGYRGSNYPEPRRMELLIDGVSFLRGDLQRIDWQSLPINLEDVYTIEVFRGPNAHTFGPNAFLAVVNIITLHPNQTQGISASTTQGSLNTSNIFVRYSGKVGDNGAFRFSLGKRENDGFDKNIDGSERLDSSDTTIGTYYYTHELDNSRIDLQGGLVKTENLQEPFFSQAQTFPATDDGNSYYHRVRWVGEINKDHRVTAQASRVYNEHKIDFSVCFPALLLTDELRSLNLVNSGYVNTLLSGSQPSGGTAQDNLLLGQVYQKIGALGGAQSAFTPLCGDTNNSSKDSDDHLKVQSDVVFSENLSTTQGFEIKRTSASGLTYVGSKETVNIEGYRFFGNAEYRSGSYLLNIGGMYVKSELAENSFLPRAALNYHLGDDQSFRFVVSKAERFPSGFEKRGDWSYEVSNLKPTLPVIGDTATFYLSSKVDGTVMSEKITSYEIGYYASFGSSTFDLKVFKDDMTSLVSELITLSNFNPTNVNSSTLTGIELETHYFTKDRSIELWTGYAYVDVDSTALSESYINPEHSGNIFASWKISDNWKSSAGIYAHSGVSSEFGPKNLSYTRAELNINRSFQVGGSAFDVTLSAQHRLDDNPELLESNNYDNKTSWFLTLSYSNE